MDIPAVDLVTERIPAVPLAPGEHIDARDVAEQPFDLRVEQVGLFRVGTDRGRQQAPDRTIRPGHAFPPGQDPALFRVCPGVVPASQVFGTRRLALGPVKTHGLEREAPCTDDFQRTGEQRIRDPQEDHGIGGEQVTHRQGGDLGDGHARIPGRPALALGGPCRPGPRRIDDGDGVGATGFSHAGQGASLVPGSGSSMRAWARSFRP